MQARIALRESIRASCRRDFIWLYRKHGTRCALEHTLGRGAHKMTRETGSRDGAQHDQVDSLGYHELADDIFGAAPPQFQLGACEAIAERLGETREAMLRVISGVVQVSRECVIGAVTVDVFFGHRPPCVQKDQGSLLYACEE